VKAEAADVRAFVVSELDGPLRDAGIDPEAVGDELDLTGEGVVDSLGMMELIMAVNERFGVDIDFEGIDADQITVVGPFTRYVAAAA
jgi:acyl carrier protein